MRKFAVIAFATTTDAIILEKYFKNNNISGRLIPIPEIISAGCGLAWKSESDDIENLKKILHEGNLKWELIELVEFKGDTK